MMYLIEPPRVKGNIVPTRDYAQMLQKTRLVYDQLLQQKAGKLLTRLGEHKAVFDKKCSELEQQDADKALEYAIEAQAKLTNMQKKAEEYMINLYEDYQKKFTNMHRELEAEWQQKNGEQNDTGS